MVGLIRLELMTLPYQGSAPNQLSYRPREPLKIARNLGSSKIPLLRILVLALLFALL